MGARVDEEVLGTRVLICDDDRPFCSFVRRLLEDEGWSVVGEVSMATEAIDFVRTVPTGIVVLDISLVGMSGIEAIPLLRQQGCAVVVCSSFGSSVHAALTAGAVAVIDKSDIGRLAEVLASLQASA